ncbi:glycosyltransferase [Pedobacter sp. L105]|uniref:glycosyltransferase n=1 Tax=Pedobacter sp. L105 TaxID=1641871 RepID=UPI00131E87D1|nr:glycosyltransferase [Pedobacter sp. L105]
MKVLIIHTYYKLRGGEDSVVENEMELLRSNGIDVELLSFSNDGNTLSKLIKMPFNYGSYQKTKAKIKSFKPDLIHIHNLHFSGSAAVIYAARNTKVPVVMTLHNYRLICPSGSLYHHNKLFLSSIASGFPWKAVKEGVYQNSSLITFWVALSMYIHEQSGTWNSVDRFIVLGEHSKDLFSYSRLSAHADRMVVKPNFCYPSPNSTAVTNDSFYLYVGRLTEEKGVPVLLDAFAKSKLPLIMVGTGPLEKLVTEFTSRHPNISFLGEQKKEKVFKLLDKAAALIFPSVWYETFGMVIIEAFSKGIPVITSDLGNMKNLVTHQFNGLTFKAGNSNDLIAKVDYYQALVIEDKQNYSRNAKSTYMKNYAPERNLEQLLKIYHSAINRRSYHPL